MNTPEADGEDFPETWIHLRPLKHPDNVPASVRVRKLLKIALRSLHLRCEQVTGKPPDDLTDEGGRGAFLGDRSR